MKIVFTAPQYLPHIGGIEMIVHQLAQFYINQGYTVTILVSDSELKELRIENLENEKIVRIPCREIGGISVLRNRSHIHVIENEVKDSDVVHLNSTKFLISFFTSRKKKYSYKLVMTSHGWFYHTKKNKFMKDLYFKHVIVRNQEYFDNIINVSSQDEQIAKEFGIKKSCVITNGVDLHKFEINREKENFTNKFLYFGRISENKGLYECLAKLAEYNREFHFNIIGKCEDSGYMKRLEQFIQDHELNNNVAFLGPQPTEIIKEMIAESDILLLPSLHEGFGMTLVECLVANRPIIANTIDTYVEILNEVGATQFLFDYTDAGTSFADKVMELRNSKIVPYNIEFYSIERMARKTLEAYEM